MNAAKTICIQAIILVFFFSNISLADGGCGLVVHDTMLQFNGITLGEPLPPGIAEEVEIMGDGQYTLGTEGYFPSIVMMSRYGKDLAEYCNVKLFRVKGDLHIGKYTVARSHILVHGNLVVAISYDIPICKSEGLLIGDDTVFKDAISNAYHEKYQNVEDITGKDCSYADGLMLTQKYENIDTTVSVVVFDMDRASFLGDSFDTRRVTLYNPEMFDQARSCLRDEQGYEDSLTKGVGDDI